ncbi:hypothetical protein CHS0354_007193 [Potamilus streckersoni]|uniref:Uncharacterized protein n=1 Tax=Potamilus streckersoni TaxID=2493646 RepID=A0AAE0W8Z6_9BIVA|nr:hypothetical protein CHS0354_007193 [Potamilus streckersoni]
MTVLGCRKLLVNKGFSFDERGEVELRGYGLLSTYFLIRNNSASDEDLIGRGKYGNTDISVISQGKQDSPFGRKNKVQPTNDDCSFGGENAPNN